MRTTIDLPDELFRKAKATAALRGVSLKDLFTDFVERCLETQPKRYGRTDPIPVVLTGSDSPLLSARTNAEIEAILDELEAK